MGTNLRIFPLVRNVSDLLKNRLGNNEIKSPTRKPVNCFLAIFVARF